MMREEAIKVLSSYDVNGVWADVDGKPYNAEEQAEAFDMAIEALQKPPISQRSMYQAGYRQAQSDAIEAIELVDWYHQNSNKDMVHGANDDEHQAWYKAEDVYKALEAVPSADRPRGEWIEEEEYGDLWVCDQCGFASEYRDNFCPNCGADMRGEDE